MRTTTKRTRRTPEQQIDALKAQIAKIHSRAERQKQKRDPSLRHISGAVRSIDKALSNTKDAPTRQALDEARATLSAVLGLIGASPKAMNGRAILRPVRSADVDAKDVLRFVTANPGSRCGDIANDLDVDTKAVSLVLKDLRAEGKVRTEGQARGDAVLRRRRVGSG